MNAWEAQAEENLNVDGETYETIMSRVLNETDVDDDVPIVFVGRLSILYNVISRYSLGDCSRSEVSVRGRFLQRQIIPWPSADYPHEQLSLAMHLNTSSSLRNRVNMLVVQNRHKNAIDRTRYVDQNNHWNPVCLAHIFNKDKRTK